MTCNFCGYEFCWCCGNAYPANQHLFGPYITSSENCCKSFCKLLKQICLLFGYILLAPLVVLFCILVLPGLIIVSDWPWFRRKYTRSSSCFKKYIVGPLVFLPFYILGVILCAIMAPFFIIGGICYFFYTACCGKNKMRHDRNRQAAERRVQ